MRMQRLPVDARASLICAGGAASGNADADRIDREADHGAASRERGEQAARDHPRASASSGRPRSPRPSRTRRFFDRVVTLRPGSGWCRDKIRPAASRSSGRSPSRVTATCGAFSSSGRISVLRRAKQNPEKYPWLTQLLARRPFKVVAVALANKMARIAWALLAKGGTYRAPALAAAA